jgi:hypothetical protein
VLKPSAEKVGLSRKDLFKNSRSDGAVKPIINMPSGVNLAETEEAGAEIPLMYKNRFESYH